MRIGDLRPPLSHETFDALAIAEPGVAEQRQAEQNDVLHGCHSFAYKRSQAYANAISSRNERIVTTTNSTSAIQAHSFLGADGALSLNRASACLGAHESDLAVRTHQHSAIG